MAITSAFQADDAGSIPATRSTLCVVDSVSDEIVDYEMCSSSSGVEHTLGKGEVGGSIPPWSSIS